MHVVRYHIKCFNAFCGKKIRYYKALVAHLPAYGARLFLAPVVLDFRSCSNRFAAPAAR